MGCKQGRPVVKQGTGGLSVQGGQHAGAADSSEAKIILLGDSGVGKSSLALRFCQGRFSTQGEVNIGAAFLQQTVCLCDGSQCKLQVWDTGGQERFWAMTPPYYRDAVGAVVVYDCTDSRSLASVMYWVRELQSSGPAQCRMAVAGNKSDCKTKVVDAKAMQAYCDENKLFFVEASAKTGENVHELFKSLVGWSAPEKTERQKSATRGKQRRSI